MSKQSLHLTDNALTVLQRRYLQKDKQGRVIETPEQMFRRVSSFIAAADANYGADEQAVKVAENAFYGMMARLDFVPNSPTLMNAGRALGQLSACFVLPVGDSMEEIFEANKNAALIHKSGGGTGFAFSRLRPRNSVVASTSGVASGPVSFMKVFNASTEAVKQGGTRRGANMGILRVDHPDIMEFITCKADTAEVTNFNISVAVTDAFMHALEQGKDYELIDPRTGRQYELDGVKQSLSAQTVFDAVVDHAWATGEPGVIFLDRINRENPTAPSETIEATNPCGEQPLPAYDSCNLGSINLDHFAVEPLPDDYSISRPWEAVDWDRLRDTIRLGVHFLDNVIDQNRYPIPEIERQTHRNRRIGLGVMGWADMLVRLGLPYNHESAFELGRRLMAFVHSEATNYSSELAKTRGKFENWEGSVYKEKSVAMRNATVTTIAPTGTISIIAGCSSGIEPYYAIAFERNVMDGTRMTEINPHFARIARERGFYSDDLVEKIIARRSISDLTEIPEDVRALFLTAADITPEEHIQMQAVFQEHTDSSVSKTINLPETATRDGVATAFRLAYRTGCKGVTIYRDNSRPNQVLSMRRSSKKDGETELSPKSKRVEERPTVLTGVTEKIKTGYGNLYVTINIRDGRPFEVFAHIGKSGYTTMADTEAICRLISLLLRSGVPISQVIRQLAGIGGSSQVFSNGARITSIPDAIAKVLQRHFGGDEDPGLSDQPAEICPECAAAMVLDSGCYLCRNCGYSSC